MGIACGYVPAKGVRGYGRPENTSFCQVMLVNHWGAPQLTHSHQQDYYIIKIRDPNPNLYLTIYNTVDGSEIPQQPPGMYKTLVNNEINKLSIG